MNCCCVFNLKSDRVIIKLAIGGRVLDSPALNP
jgi:hypothetical protein